MNNKPKCKLIGTDGNAFAIIGKVVQILKRANQHDKAVEFKNRALKTGSYDELLNVSMEYVEVE